MVLFFVKGWFRIKFRTKDDVDNVLLGVSLCKEGSIMLKRWFHSFDPKTYHLHYHHPWVLLPCCPLQFWNKESFIVIGNEIGNFLHV